MEGEQETVAAGLDTSPAPGGPAEPEGMVNDQIEASDDDAASQADEGLEAGDDEFEEFDWEGKKVRGPKGLKDGVLRNADYTRKTQEVAAARRELEAKEQAIVQQIRASEEELDARATLRAIDARLQEYSQVDWETLNNEDIFAHNHHWRQYQQLKEQRGEVVNDLSNRQQWRTVEAQRDFARRAQETQEFAQKQIKGWSPETNAQVLEFAASKGVTEQMIRDTMSPLVYEMLYLARVGEQALKAQPAKQPSPTLAPTATVRGKANPASGKSLSDMSMDEYAAYRQKKAAGR